ncbi:hypothetical protein Tco_1254427 [Tanacetum coccineum]
MVTVYSCLCFLMIFKLEIEKSLISDGNWLNERERGGISFRGGTMIHVAKEEMYNFLPNAASTWELTIRRVPIDGLAEFSQVDLTGSGMLIYLSYFATMDSGMKHEGRYKGLHSMLEEEHYAINNIGLPVSALELRQKEVKIRTLENHEEKETQRRRRKVEDPLLKDDKLKDIQAISDSGILKLSKNTEKKKKNLYSTLGAQLLLLFNSSLYMEPGGDDDVKNRLEKKAVDGGRQSSVGQSGKSEIRGFGGALVIPFGHELQADFVLDVA